MLLRTSTFIKLCLHPNFVVRIALLTLIIALECHATIGQRSQNEMEDIEIIVERTPYSLKFSINDTEKYELQNVTCNSINAVDQFGNDENECKDLLPCTNYRATLSIQDLTTMDVFNRDLYNETDYAEPKVVFSKIEPTTNSILLTWTTDDNTCVVNYTIQVKYPGENIEKVVSNKQNEFLIDDLHPCVEHSIEMRTYDIKQKLVSTLNENVTTQYAEPGNVTNIVIDTNYEHGKSKVTWNSPDNKTCINLYYLKWFTMDCVLKNRRVNDDDSSENSAETPEDDDVCEWFAEVYDSDEFIIKDLDGCEAYGLQIFINNKENAKSEVKQFISAEGMPDKVTIETPNVEATEVTLHWAPPKKNSKCVKKYEIKVEGPKQIQDHDSQNIVTSNKYVIFYGLYPCGSYSYTISPILLNGTKGDAASSELEMSEGKPTAVQNPIIMPEPYAFLINWEKPSFAELCVKEYRLVVWTNGKSPIPTHDEIIKGLSTHVTGLIACQSYTIQIIPRTKLSEQGEVNQIESETAAAIAHQPENFQFTDRYSDGLELSTRSNDINNTCDIIFARFICKPNSGDDEVPKKTAERNVEGKVGGTSFKALLSPLSPFTEYSCFASFFNIAGWSPEKQIVVSTLAYYADIPREISVKTISQSTVFFKWEPPLYPNGNINVYMGHFQRVRSEFYSPPNCPPTAIDFIDRVSTGREMLFSSLQPFVRYSIQVAAENEYGVGEYTRPFMVVTYPSVSEPVKDLKVFPQGPYESDEVYQAYVLVNWTTPCKSNGQIQSFELEFRGERGEEIDHFHQSVPPEFDKNGTVTYNETNIKPDFRYKVSVVVRNFDVEGTSAEIHEKFDAPAGIPKRFDETTMSQARVDAFEAANPTSSAVVRFPAYILESETGSIIYAALLLSQKDCNGKPNLVFGALKPNVEWPESRKWNDVYSDEENNCILQYQTTYERWKPIPKPGSNEIEFTVGTEICENSDDRYCNGPLTPDTEFYLVIRLFTRSGYNDAAILEFRTDSLVQLKIILISVSCCLLLAFIAGFVYIYITKRMLWKRQSYHDIEDPFGDIMAKNFAKYYSDVSKPEKLSREFKELTMVAMDFSYTASEMGHNKNRYVDIYPYDKNRVILDIDADGSDYINASFINGYRRKKEYIATQGPKPESTLDFWRMVLQHQIRVIVMVTQFREGDKIKCHEYYPYKSMGINVTVKKKETFDLYDRSEMSVTHDRYGLKQKVVHFYFKKWPDYGCPDDPMQLITFVRKVKAEKVPSYSSIVVHCSAGVGRTGTFIGLDIIMQRIKSESKINIYGTVKKLRFQRMKMVQSLEQYTFLYKCAYELVKHKDQRALQKIDKKKVSFQDDLEANSGGTTNASIKTISRPLQSDLSSIQENELEYNENLSSSHKLNGKPHLIMTEIPLPSTSNGLSSHDRAPQSIAVKSDDISLSESTM